ncbi:chitinase [Streptomyces sp. NPDC058548]|uniref:chitinase n=1 Tax=unclassified Streptomyces TaxID=2593676 RepID=UPI003667EC2D
MNDRESRTHPRTGVLAAALCATILVAGLGFVAGRVTADPAQAPSSAEARQPAARSPSPEGKPDPARVPRRGQEAGAGTTRLAGFSPYVDVSVARERTLLDLARDTGAVEFTLAFVVAKDGCTPGWGGGEELWHGELMAQVRSLRSAGGDVRVSFGGANGTELSAACRDEEELAAAYRAVLDAYGLTKADFDIEGATLEDTAANNRRARAVARLQREAVAAGRPLDVTFTLAVMPDGLTEQGRRFVEEAVRAGVTPSAVNIMAMNYAPEYDGRMAAYAIEAATSAHADLEPLLGRGDAGTWRSLRVTAMIGVNDIPSEVFEPDDARRLVAFARTWNLAGLSLWSVGRDRPCATGPKEQADAECSSIAQKPDEFLRIFAAYQGPLPAGEASPGE